MQLDKLNQLFFEYFKEPVVLVHPINTTLSSRRKVRLIGDSKRAIGVYSPNPKETSAFIEIGKHLSRTGVSVPMVLAQDRAEPSYYIENDLGETTLNQLIVKDLKGNCASPSRALELIKMALTDLVRLQFEGFKGFPFQWCFPNPEYDEQSLLWDLDYFKYHFLLLTDIEIDEAALAKDMRKLVSLLPTNCPSIIHRDFQGRNIVVDERNRLHYLDFQGARRGPAEYDVASLVYQRGITSLSDSDKAGLAEFYFETAKSRLGYDRQEFQNRLQLVRLYRNLQTLGTRGRRGLFQGHTAIVSSIPQAINEVGTALQGVGDLASLPELSRLLPIMQEKFPQTVAAAAGLSVKLSSFSYRRSIPRDYSEHGGGFVFDCRSLSNPHLDPKLRDFNGTQREIKDYLSKDSDIQEFEASIKNLILGTINRYLDRGYNALSIDFGCTGGKHRSVYMAEAIGSWLRKQFETRGVTVCVRHRELGIDN